MKGEYHENIKCNRHFSWLSKNEFKKNTIKNYQLFLTGFKKDYGNSEISKITSEDIMGFLAKR
ncbi:hypothetical protein DO021_02820 [Desulfobacter hydrogenophilus]|uniref:Core-binding (CB) domain-containing protein n=1 Tax=Desulfobacter hydrogenophilus TaxID=2291 RepID=A0A328FFR5_9BACT|nr:hypothetical protein [Desulfobacter hydrogenophilus]QBH15512.1 hypothetical protein EYB58_04295 [Desulfobacter hydrogenophilus]RAM03464.1 hypothetical protein DO021_02820 [Desulfobacter hydrogenophilus]